MSSGSHRSGVVDRGVVDFYRALELTGNLPDFCRIGGTVRHASEVYRIVKVSRLEPEHGGVVVLAEHVQ